MMNEYVHPFAETFEDFLGLGTRGVYDGGNDVRSSFSDIPVAHGIQPSVSTPLLSYGGTPSSPLVGSHNGWFPINEFNFGQPSPEIYGSIREHFPKNKEHDHDRTNREARHWQKQSNRYQKDLEQCQSERKDLSIRLFQSLKDLKKYDEAEERYHEISKR